MRSAEAPALLRDMKIRFTPMTPMVIMLKYVRKARITPGFMSPSFTRLAPRITTRARPMFRQSCMKGPGMAMTVAAAMSRSAISSLARAKRRFSKSDLLRAFTTRIPVIFSRMMRTTASSFSWTVTNMGMPLEDTKRMIPSSSGSITTMIMARGASMVMATNTPPTSMMGARTHRVCSCWEADCTL